MPEFPKFDPKYLKDALKEPVNLLPMGLFALAAAYVQDASPLVAFVVAETLYLHIVPASSLIVVALTTEKQWN